MKLDRARLEELHVVPANSFNLAACVVAGSFDEGYGLMLSLRLKGIFEPKAKYKASETAAAIFKAIKQ